MSKFTPDSGKLEHVKNVHKNILHKRKMEENIENRRILEQSISEGRHRTFLDLFNIPKTLQYARPIEIPEFAKERNTQRRKAIGKISLTIPELYLHKVESRPPRTYFTPSQINIEVEDAPALQYFPYFDDNDEDDDFLSNLLEAHDNKCHEPKDTSLCLPVIIKLVEALKNGVDGKDVVNVKPESNELPSAITSPNSLAAKARASRASTSVSTKGSKAQMNGSNTFGWSFTDHEIFEYISILSEEKDHPLKASEVKDLYENHVSPKDDRQTMANIDKSLDKFYNVDQALDTYMKLFCQMCNIYDCFQHNGYEINKKRLHNMHLNSSPCSDECFMNLDSVNISDYFAKNESFSDDEKSSGSRRLRKIPERSLRNRRQLNNNQKTLLNVYMDTYKNNYCSITQLMKAEMSGDINCCEIYLHAQDIKKMLGEKTTPMERIKIDKNKKPKKQMKKKAPPKPDKRNFYVPCNHPGESCKTAKDCSCAINGTYCEKYCICTENVEACDQSFPGCRCAGGCQTTKCPCYLASRECDEDLCKGTSHIHSSSEGFTCKNVSIQRGYGKHLLLGVSQVAGWGVFLNGTAEKNDLISEYCGELISHHEAESRGIVYDKTGLSFLFEVIKDSKTCDAKNVGNKIRFANHDPEDPNCYPKIMRVNGLLRIGIYAKRRIREQEELFFDYGSVKFQPADRVAVRD